MIWLISHFKEDWPFNCWCHSLWCTLLFDLGTWPWHPEHCQKSSFQPLEIPAQRWTKRINKDQTLTKLPNPTEPQDPAANSNIYILCSELTTNHLVRPKKNRLKALNGSNKAPPHWSPPQPFPYHSQWPQLLRVSCSCTKLGRLCELVEDFLRRSVFSTGSIRVDDATSVAWGLYCFIKHFKSGSYSKQTSSKYQLGKPSAPLFVI